MKVCLSKSEWMKEYIERELNNIAFTRDMPKQNSTKTLKTKI